MNNTTKLVYLLCVSGLASRVAAQVAAEKAAELENRPTTYNNTSIPDNAKALHKYFMAKNITTCLTNSGGYAIHAFSFRDVLDR